MDIKELMSKPVRLAPGHRSCAGCAFPIIVRNVLRASDKPVVVANATGCLEVTTTIYPFTSWKVPFIHSAFENAAATLSGVERAYMALRKKGQIKKEIKFVAFGGDGGCYSDDTEIFTEKGFVNVKKLKVGDKIWSVNPNSNELEITVAEKMFKYKVDGNMVRVKTRFMDYFVTPDHNVPMWYKGKWKFIHARDLLTRYKTMSLRSFLWTGKKIKYYYPHKIKQIKNQKVYNKFPIRSWLRFLGWFIAEGTLYKSKSGYLIRIYQSNKKGRNEILKILKELGINAFECSRSVDFHSKQIYYILHQEVGKYSKERRIPRWILQLEKSLLKEIYITLMKGDGSSSVQKGRSNPHLRYITSSERLMNTFVELVFKLGFNCQVSKRKDGCYSVGISTIHLKHIIYSRRNIYKKQGTKQVKEEKYKGFVYCPQLKKNHTVIIKRNNKICLNGNSYDIGLQSISGTLERGHDILYVCYDNEAYANTGVQRSSATPFGASTTTTPYGKVHPGKETHRKDLTKLIAAHNIPYVAQAAVHNWQDLVMKAKKGFEVDGPAFINVLSPCIPGWKIKPDETIDISKKAVMSRFWPLFEIENGEYNLNFRVDSPIPVEEFLKPQGRFKHLFTPENRHIIDKIQSHVDKEWDKLLKLCNEL